MISINIQIDGRLVKGIRVTRRLLANRKVLAGLAAVALTVPVVAIASPLTVPHTFSSNTVISSTEMNENFTAVETSIDDNASRISALESAPDLRSCTWAMHQNAGTSSTVSCPANHFVVYGGCQTDSTSSVQLVQSTPVPAVANNQSATAITGWTCKYSSNGGWQAIALCCPN